MVSIARNVDFEVQSLQVLCARYVQRNMSQYLPLACEVRELIDAQRFVVRQSLTNDNKIYLSCGFDPSVDLICDDMIFFGIFGSDDVDKLTELYENRIGCHILPHYECIIRVKITESIFSISSSVFEIFIPKSRGLQLVQEALDILQKMIKIKRFYKENRKKYERSHIFEMISREFDIPRNMLI